MGMGKYSGRYSLMDMYRLCPVTLPVEATGGVISDVEIAGIIYRIHKFTTVGADTFNVTFTPGAGALLDFLVVAGGGSGGNHNTTNANGGGGGVLYKQGHAVQLGNFPVMVGNGGAAVANIAVLAGNNGENSYFGTSLPSVAVAVVEVTLSITLRMVVQVEVKLMQIPPPH